jgi:hypothetical protein
MRVSDAGGTPTPVTRIENARGEQHSEPAFLPDGRRFLYLKTFMTAEENGIFVGDSDTSPENQDGSRLLVADSGTSSFPYPQLQIRAICCISAKARSWRSPLIRERFSSLAPPLHSPKMSAAPSPPRGRDTDGSPHRQTEFSPIEREVERTRTKLSGSIVRENAWGRSARLPITEAECSCRAMAVG